jgi:hypothetical protein
MKPFSNLRTPRRTTFLALIVWLFVLASGDNSQLFSWSF